MPKDNTIQKVLVIGAGPIAIGQGCEFDYAGTQACKALREEGCQVVLINSNPATIMTDPDSADATYIEPLTLEALEKIIAKERPDALLPTMGGQTALNCTLQLAHKGVLDAYGIRVIGSSLQTIECAENRERFKQIVQDAGLPVLKSFHVTDLAAILDIQIQLRFPMIVRCSYALGGQGGGIAYTETDLIRLCKHARLVSPSGLLIEESIIGWKEFELEVMRDRSGTSIVVCGIENVDPMGVHTGDSITVAPIQTLTDKEYQRMRSYAFSILERVGLTAGGCNVQFAIHPLTGDMRCIEINPRVSRSSALASKATGFPIARIAAKLALGYHLHELKTDVFMPFEPTLDYVVVKLPYFNFNKFPEADRTLNTAMKAVGEVMAIGRTFKEALQKAISSLEQEHPILSDNIENALSSSNPEKLWTIAEAIRQGWSLEQIQILTCYDLWFLKQIAEIVDCESQIKQTSLSQVDKELLHSWKQLGFSDLRLANLLGVTEDHIWQKRQIFGVLPTYKPVEPCAGEFSRCRSALYSTYEEACEAKPSNREKVIVLGSGPNRIGQGIEFDYCCVHAIQALRACGYEAIMINSNPSTVSTDSDISDKLYFAPLTVEHVHEICRIENPKGLIVQFGGQTPLDIGKRLHARGLPLLGTPFDAIECATSRDRLRMLLKELVIPQPENDTYTTREEAFTTAQKLNYPVVIRPSHIIGGNTIRIVTNQEELERYLERHPPGADPVLIEQFLAGGIEVEVDAIADGCQVYICGIIEHIDPVGIHSGDSICSLTPVKLDRTLQDQLREYTVKLGQALTIKGLFNVQFAVVDETIYVIEVNPRASRTIPLLSKITGLPYVQMATRCILGGSLDEDPLTRMAKPCCYAVKVPVFPFNRLPGSKTCLGPQMYSTGETLGIGMTYEEAFYKVGTYLEESIRLSEAGTEQLARLPSNYAFDVYALQTLR